jgi:hypothetical protein
MKIYFPERGPDAFLTRKPGASWISLIIGCFFAGVCGSYFLGNHFISLTIIVLGIGGILVGAAIVSSLNWSKVDRTHSAPARKKAPRITSEWRYRPREAIRRYATTNSVSAETSDVLGPENFVINNNVWFNNDSLEYVADPFPGANR